MNSWLIHDMIRICPQTGNVLEEEARHRSLSDFESKALNLVSPRNGYVSFQTVIRLDDSSACDGYVDGGVFSSGHDEIPSREYRFYAQWYHRIKERYYPDALVPLAENASPARTLASVMKQNAVPGQTFAAVWVDFFVPADVRPGEYRGMVTVRQGAAAETHPVVLKVLETAVPDESLLTADLNSYADNLSNRMDYLRNNEHRYQDGTYFKVERQFFTMAHEHRCLLHYLPYQHSGKVPAVFVPELEGKGTSMRVKDWSTFDEHFGPYLDGSAFQDTKRGPIPIPYMYLPLNFHWPADYVKFGTKGYRTEFTAIFNEFHRHFSEKGWQSTKFEFFLNHKKRYKLFPYDGDETRFMWDEKINDIFYDLGRDVFENKDGAQFVFRTDSSWSYGLHFEKYAAMIKLWAVNEQIFSWFPESLDVLREAGSEVWTYGAAPKISQSLLGTAISPLTAVARGVNGFNYWENTKWGDRWYETPDAEGSTAVFYPGDRLFGILGPIPSIRLKTLRNTMQVTDCMEQWIRRRPEQGRAKMREIIEDALGLEHGSWWPGKPRLLDLPPYKWEDSFFSEAPEASLHRGQAPETCNDLKQNLWAILG